MPTFRKAIWSLLGSILVPLVPRREAHWDVLSSQHNAGGVKHQPDSCEFTQELSQDN